jgi:hypothetical protein
MGQIKIGWKYYPVVISDKVVSDGKECYGRIDYNNPIIELRKSNTLEQQKATLLHEIIHGLDDFLNLGFEEEEVLLLANGLYSVFIDNPDIFSMKLKEDEI